MECRKDCPVLGEIAETTDRLNGEVERATDIKRQNEALLEQNRATARQLASLPPTPDVAEARSALQAAVIQVSEAQTKAINSIDLLHTAIEAGRVAGEVLLSNCPGGPCYVDDPSQPGNKALACASPGAYGN